jgi:hypothetical protein
MANLYTPERLEGEDFERYKVRRRASRAAVKVHLNPYKPTLFVQHYNNIKNPEPRGAFVPRKDTE